MQIKQFEDKNLSHYSYAVVSDCEKKMVIIDPARNCQTYLDHAAEKGCQIVGVIETHPHADFVSGHLELHQQTGATIYASARVQALYPHQAFDEVQSIQIGKIKLTVLNTPGHSPDSICILLEHDGQQKAVFTGDTLFVGDCGRPDLREEGNKFQAKKEELAKQLYHSLREKLAVLNDHVVVYPAHGAGTLCGKNLGKESSSTIGKEKENNWCLQPATEVAFVERLLADLPFVPQYFPFSVELNRKGAAPLQESLSKIAKAESEQQPLSKLDAALWVVDTRTESDFKAGHLPHAINLMEKGKFETWLGSLIAPGERFYLAGENSGQLERMKARAASIGYETAIAGTLLAKGTIKEASLDLEDFKKHQHRYTIIDVRNSNEVEEGLIFPHSLSIPLAELRDRVGEIPTSKPIVVHCAGGYRSAAGSSLIQASLDGRVTVFDLGETVKEFLKKVD